MVYRGGRYKKTIYCLLCTGHRFSQPHILFTVSKIVYRIRYLLTVYCLLFTVFKTVNSTKITVKKKNNSTAHPCLVPGALDEYEDDDEDFGDDEEED